MDIFLDTCIIIANFDEKDKFYLLAKRFISKNKSFIISIYQEKKELPYFFFRKDKILSEAIKFSAYSSYSIDTKDLRPKDELNLKKIIAQIKAGSLMQSELLIWKREIYLLRQKINYFIRNNISRRVTPLEKIDSNLVNLLNSLINNKADCYILASAIQESKQIKLIIITTDKGDWNRERIVEIIKQTSYKEVPEIKYLQDMFRE
ncbi:hypothetical protein FJZ19_04990 [Candidatus Pacearchaeota archaeon]|nr:hypothetical protein [Candidatus Pacearchaeota archaeon]